MSQHQHKDPNGMAHRGASRVHYRHLEKTLVDKLAFLGRKENYPHPTSELVAVETRMAWIFLTDQFAYKLKKPVFEADQDYSTIDARHRDSKVELLLNSYLAKDTYLGVEALLVNCRGELQLSSGQTDPDGAAGPCDWLLKMRRLPAKRMLDYLLTSEQVDLSDAEAVGQRLGQFYRGRPPVAISFLEYKERFRRGIAANEQLIAGEPSLKARIKSIGKQQYGFINQRGKLLDDSLCENRVIECHGDLRPEHICVEAEIRVIDCLQFFRDYRLTDYFDDVGFLALECERMGCSSFGEHVIAQVARTNITSAAPRGLIHFYQSFRAAIRARLALRHLNSATNDHQKWLAQTNVYLDLAEKHIRSAIGPTDFDE